MSNRRYQYFKTDLGAYAVRDQHEKAESRTVCECVHADKMSSRNRFQKVGFSGHFSRASCSQTAMKILA